ncbi:HET-domain-containing protein [Annulohypoxylon maeteangense]|uniref:HET-domain-containing protein n=1 Tax=Annulohypoxylon maeteangense TaxID=1927788 RepID=UPI0020078E84|nr:HET-domain-containing protein [Annulohypoxylon maeteangense]KAI0880285.1 HET-domain-containing protein [Annulohypoxylon maeteangense]
MNSPTSRNLCTRCNVLRFNDSAFGYGVHGESGRQHFQIQTPKNAHSFLDFSLKDRLPKLPIISGSVQNGCAFCAILRKLITKSCSYLPEQEIHIRLQLVFSPEGRFMSVLAHVGLQLEQGSDEILLMFGVDGDPYDPCTQWLRLQSAPEDHIFCKKNVEKIGNILQDIESEENRNTPFYPTRLINVGTGDDDTCHLVITDPGLLKAKGAKYAALSYCWGPHEDAKTQFKTERANLPNRIAGFKSEITSPAMREAVEVCRSLDIPYIWIDAVCIVQDDKEDWEREAAQMTDVYQNACLTICTPTSTSCREGFLGPRVSARIPFRSGIDVEVVGFYNIRPCGAIGDIRSAEGDYESFDNSDTGPRGLSNWWKRGWTFQELALSKRVLLFGIKLHLVFEDRFWSEGDESLTEAVEDEDAAAGMGGTFAVIAVAGALESREDESMWMSMVEQYTERQLTFESDKLPAMGGLAKIAVRGNGDGYLAGIRRESLHRDLFWTPAIASDAGGEVKPKASFDELMKSLNEPEPYIAPSWSWARWRGKVRFDESPAPYGDHVPVMGVHGKLEEAYSGVEARTSTSKLNPFGQVTEGSLRLTSKVVPILQRLERQEGFDNHWEMCNENGQYVANLTFDWDEPKNVVPFENLSLAYNMALLYDNAEGDSEEDEVISDYDEINVDVNMDSSEDGDEQMDDIDSESEEISFEEAQVRDANAGRFAYGLIIHPANAKGKFFRVGIFSSWPKGAGGLKGYFENQPSTTVEII